MTGLDERTKSKVNRLYFKENMTIPAISEKTEIPYSVVLHAIDRGDVYKIRGRRNGIKNNKEVIDIIISVVSEYFGLREGIIIMKTRIRDVIVPRQIAQTISYNLTKSTNAFIGSEIGGFNHSTIIHNRRLINQLLSYNNDTSFDYLKIEEICVEKIKEYEELLKFQT